MVKTLTKVGGTSWDTEHDRSTDTSRDDSGTFIFAKIQAKAAGDYDMRRSFILFDVSSIFGTIDSAVISLHVISLEDGDNDAQGYFAVVGDSTPASDTSIVTGDNDQHGALDNPTKMGADVDITGLSTGVYSDQTVTTDGLTSITNATTGDGILRWSVREGHDIEDIPIAASSSNRLFFASADTSGTGSDPKLVIQHTLYSITGTVYTDEGVTPIASGKKVSVAINGETESGSGTTIAGGQFTATLTGNTLTGGSLLILWLDDETEDAVTVSFGSGSNMTGVHLYQDRLIIRSNTGSVSTGNASPLANSDLDITDNAGDSDISAIFNVDSNTELQVSQDKELFVWAGSLFTPGGKVMTHDLDVRGTLTLESNVLTVSGSLVTVGTMTTSTEVLLTGVGDANAPETLSGGSTVFQNLTLDNGLIGYWRLDDGTGSTIARDSSRSGNNGTLSGMDPATDWAPLGAPGITFFDPGSLDFDGVNDFVSVANGGGLNNLQTGTIALWVQWNGIQDEGFREFGHVTSRQNNGIFSNHIIGLDTNDPALSGVIWKVDQAGGSPDITGATAVGDGTWRHVAVTYTGGSHFLYLDGSQDGSATTTVVIGDNISTVFSIGAWDGDGAGFSTSLIDDVRVYNRILSASEVSSLANGNQYTGSGVYTLGNALDVDGDLGLYDSTLRTGNAYGITVSGSWLGHGRLSSTGTVTLDGTNQTISGNTIFNNLTVTRASTGTLFFDFQGRQSVSGALTLQGAAGNLLILRSTLTGSASNLLLDGSAGTQTIDNLDVQDSDASGGAELECLTASEGCVDSGNNTNWSFSSAVTTPQAIQLFQGYILWIPEWLRLLMAA